MEQIFELGEYTIFTKVEGEGAPLLLLHSYLGSQFLFDRMTQVLSEKRMVIRIDLPGHGKSGPPAADYSFDSFAIVLNELLNHLDIHEKVSIVGHSMGGYLALAYVAKYSERIASLILMHSPVKYADILSIKQRNRESVLLLKGKKELLLQVTIPSNFAPENSGKMEDDIRLLNYTATQVTLEGALGSINAINQRRNNLRVLKNARYPLLIIIGKYDKVYNAEEQLNDACQISSAEVLYLEHSGHLGFLEEEELVLMRLNDFLERKS